MNWFKTFFWMIALSVILVLVGSLFGRGGLIIGLGIALVTNGLAYFTGDKIAIAAAQAKEVGPAEAPELHRLADRLAAQYGVPKPRVYISPDPNPNAFATGRNPRHASIVVNQGLLRILDPEEVYGVLAHEFAHVRNRDILISSVVAVMAAAITFLAQMGFFFGGGSRDQQGSSPLGLVGGLLLLILGPIAALLIQLAVSRSREYEADHTGAEVSHDPLALASALRKLQRGSEVVPSPIAQPAFAHLYIVNPLSGQTLGSLFSTHPPLEKRIQRLEEMARQR
ncbi:MAG: M48 family metalloprotease [Candidatus Dormibacteraeota bacterium]|jgi:heat shock protein HtpX|nr:M48 family metalloprotease [Candidatus Dormibacteraeota bacterium]